MNATPRQRRQSTLAVAAALAFGAAPLQHGHAAACSFVPTSGNWSASGNWTCGVVPSGPAGDSATIASGRTATVHDAPAPGTTRSIFTLANAGTLQITGPGFALQSGGSTINSSAINAVGGPLVIERNHVVNNQGGQLNASGNGNIVQLGGTLLGGTIETTGNAALVVSSELSNGLSGVTLRGRMDMSTLSDSRQRVGNGMTLGNNSLIAIDSGGVLSLFGTQTIAGSGSLVFGSHPDNRIDLESSGTSTLASGVIVRGATGTIGLAPGSGGTQVLANQGTISADVAGGTITLTGASLLNSGTLSAHNGGRLVLASNLVGTASGQIQSSGLSAVVQSGGTLGGVLNIGGAMGLAVDSSDTNRLTNATVNGTLNLALGGSRQRVSSGGMVLNGAMFLDNSARLIFEGTGGVSASGNGSADISFGFGGNNRIELSSGSVTTFGSNTVVRGANGEIGGQVGVLINDGTISADALNGTIRLTAAQTLNNGTLRAHNGGTLVLGGQIGNGANGRFVIGAGSQVRQDGAMLGGVLDISGAGRFTVSNDTANTLNGVTLNGNLDMASAGGSFQRVVSGLTLNGRIDLGDSSVLRLDGPQSIQGNGSIVFGSGGRIELGAGNHNLLAGVTVRGGNGTIGAASGAATVPTLTHLGTIRADVAGRTILIADDTNLLHLGTLGAANGGSLVLQGNVTGGAAGQIVTAGGGRVVQSGGTWGGVFNIAGTSVLSVDNASGNRLSSATINGTLDMASSGSSRERVSGTLTLNGTALLDNGARLVFDNGAALNGNATLVFGGTAQSAIEFGSGSPTVFGSNTRVRGANGVIGNPSIVAGPFSPPGLINRGVINADVAGGTITVAGLPVLNEGTLRADNGGRLVLAATIAGSTGSQIGAGAGSQVLQSGAAILNSVSSGRLSATGSSDNLLQGVTINGQLDLASIADSRERVRDGLTLNGTIDINANGNLRLEGTQTLAGSGSIVFGNTVPSQGVIGNRIVLEDGGTTTIAAGITVRGTVGAIGGPAGTAGTPVLNNQGTISADTAFGALQISDTTLINGGTLSARNSGTLLVSVPLSGSGTLLTTNGGTVVLSGGNASQGRLVMGAGTTLNLGPNSLVVGNDYTNAGAGSGNDFNRRAGVIGSGQILAGGDARQLITGPGVSNGASTNATLTIGNVHVGSTNIGYRIGNGGTSGPVLRGAIQTGANGGQISDIRLSGSGVSASNYNAGGPGSSSGPLTVTFTTGSAGVLAPLHGQSVNLRSNFENIPDQKLQIVLAAGAAAYHLASASAPSAVVVANQRVGGSNSSNVVVANTAPGGAFSEDLNTVAAGFSGSATGSGGISGRLAGSNNTGSGAITVGVSTTSAGAKTGSVTLFHTSTGTVAGVSNGLGSTSAGSQTVAVSGNVYQAASGQLVSAPLNFGTVQVGQVVSRDLVVRNTATGPSGFVEDLNVSFGGASGTGAGLISGSGRLLGITAGSTSDAANGTMTVRVDTGSAGTVNGAIAIRYTSAGAVGGVSNGLGGLVVGGQNFGVAGSIQTQATVIHQASPSVANPVIDLGARRVGDAAPTAAITVGNIAVGSLQAALNASISSNGAPVAAGGSINLLAPGATSNTLRVALDTGVAGDYTGANAGSATIRFFSDAGNVGNCGRGCQIELAPQTVSVSGKVYAAAAGQLQTTVLDFGIVRVGDTPGTRDIVVSNAAATSGLNDTLGARLGGIGGPFVPGSAVLGVQAQGTGAIALGLNTGAAGVFEQLGQVSFVSQNADMADTSAGSNADLRVRAQVNRLANADFDLLSGAGLLTRQGDTYTLDLGAIALGSNGLWTLQLDNEVSGPADRLRGLFDLVGTDDFALGGFGAIDDLAAGDARAGLSIGFFAGAAGSYEDEIRFDGFSFNASDPTGLAQSRRLVIRASVFDTGTGGVLPEPGTLALLLGALLALKRKGSRQGLPR